MQVIDIIIATIIILLLCFGSYKMWLQLSGRKTCCGGSKEIVKPKKLKKVVYTKIFYIDGMHCDHCKNSITKAINLIGGVSGEVDLSQKCVKVSYEYEIKDEKIIEGIEAKGFEVVKVENKV